MRDYICALNEAIASGVDFDSGFFMQPSSKIAIIVDLAKAHGYRKPKQANGSTGRYFFKLLQRQYDKRKGELTP